MLLFNLSYHIAVCTFKIDRSCIKKKKGGCVRKLVPATSAGVEQGIDQRQTQPAYQFLELCGTGNAGMAIQAGSTCRSLLNTPPAACSQPSPSRHISLTLCLL